MEELACVTTRMLTLINSLLGLNKAMQSCVREEITKLKFKDVGEMSRASIMDLFMPCIETLFISSIS